MALLCKAHVSDGKLLLRIGHLAVKWPITTDDVCNNTLVRGFREFARSVRASSDASLPFRRRTGSAPECKYVASRGVMLLRVEREGVVLVSEIEVSPIVLAALIDECVRALEAHHAE